MRTLDKIKLHKKVKMNCSFCLSLFELPFWKSKTQKVCSQKCNGKLRKYVSSLKNKRECKNCNLVFTKISSSKGLFCSHKCYSINKKVYGEKPNCNICNKKLSSHNNLYCRICIYKVRRGEKHHAWIKDRTLLKDDHRNRGGQLHREWSNSVKNRDKICRIADVNCDGRLEAHHILGWTKYPELRYDIKNGITLCHAHHPRKKSDETKLSPYFQKLVAEMK